MVNRVTVLDESTGTTPHVLQPGLLVPVGGGYYAIVPGLVVPAVHAITHDEFGTDPLTLTQNQVTGLVAALAALTTADGLRVLKAGDTMTGALLVNAIGTKIGNGTQAQQLIIDAGGPALTTADLMVLKAALYPYFQFVNNNSGGGTAAGFKIGIESNRPSIVSHTSGWPIDFYTRTAGGVLAVRMTLEAAGSLSCNHGVKTGSAGTLITQTRIYTPTLTPAACVAGPNVQTFTVAGLTTADTVTVNGPAATAGTALVHTRVSAADTLELTWWSNGALVPTSGVYRVKADRS